MGKYFNLTKEAFNLAVNPSGTALLKVKVGVQEVDDVIGKKYPSIFEPVVEDVAVEKTIEDVVEEIKPIEETEVETTFEEIHKEVVKEIIDEEDEEKDYIKEDLELIIKQANSFNDKKELEKFAMEFDIDLKRNRSLINMKIDFVDGMNKREMEV